MAGDLDTRADHGVGDVDGAQQRAEVVALGEEMLAADGSVGGQGTLQIEPWYLGRRPRPRCGTRGWARSGIRPRLGPLISLGLRPGRVFQPRVWPCGRPLRPVM